jgi:hypothetical protein
MIPRALMLALPAALAIVSLVAMAVDADARRRHQRPARAAKVVVEEPELRRVRVIPLGQCQSLRSFEELWLCRAFGAHRP